MKEKVNVTGVPETMVQTLYARAKETRKKNAKINDEIAEELVKNLDYDFSKADKDKAMNYGVIARTIVLDRMVEQYLEKNTNTIVINIACGLDTRCYRMKGKYLHWYNIDLPETMKIRRQFLPETGPIYQIAKSAMDDSYVDDIDYHSFTQHYRKYRNYPCVCLANPFVSVLSTQNGNVCADCVKYNTWDCPIYCYRIRKYNSMVVCTVLLGSKTGRATYGN